MDIQSEGHKLFNQVEQEMKGRAFRASNELRNALQYVMRGQRSGRRYRVPFTYSRRGKKRKSGRYYTASAPGEAPAVRTGALRGSFWPRPRAIKSGNTVTIYPAIESPLKYGKRLDEGTPGGKIAPRPFKTPTIERAKDAIKRIYKAPYLVR